MLLEIEAPKAKAVRAKVTYFAPGLDWDVTYSLYVDERKGEGALIGYARVMNRTGRELRNVKVRLATLTKEVLEEILRLLKPEERMEVERKPRRPRKKVLVRPEAVPLVAKAPPPPAPVPPPPETLPEVVAEYWEVPLPGKHDLPARGEVDVLVLSSQKVKGEVLYTLGTAARRRKFRFLEVRNEKGHGLPGTALLPGRLWAFVKGPAGSYTFSLSEPLKYAPPGARVLLPLGPSRDLKVKRRVASYSVSNLRYVSERRSVVFDVEKSVEFELENLSAGPIKVEIRERLHPEAEVVDASHKFERPKVTELKFSVRLGAGERAKVSYRVRYRGVSPAHPILREIVATEVAE
ncbi:MAG TPA: DUF4139 domain-containing protein [Armatimonadetes bacterium]|nr:DUF4139 domain-containing protein [Armatimonadota bacterium]